MSKFNKNNIETEYTADSIKVLEGLEAVRVRPAMYIGSTGSMGLHHLVFEVVDNSIDEAMAGHCTQIDVTIHFDNSITVIDDGRGIPVDMHKEENRPAAEVVMTTLHAGGKFDKESYKVSGGLHGVGVSCVNALSSKLELEVKRNGAVYYQKYEFGKPVTEFKQIGHTRKRGTKIRFWPDEDIFEDTEYDYGILSKRLKELAFLNRGITINLLDERSDKKESFIYEGGISEYVTYLSQGKEKIHPNPIHIFAKREEMELEICFQYSNSYTETILSFVNNINTIEGGTHLSGFKSALTRTFNSFAQANQLFKKDFKGTLSGEDAREGIYAVVSIKIKEPQFEGQTKAKLGNSDVKGIVESIINEKLTEFFEENINIAKSIINKAFLAAQAREASRKAKELVRKSSLLENTTLPGKLADCQSKSPEDSEIFIVEGDSAGGSAKQGRNRKFQAILPLRGKILNVEKASLHRMFDSQEIKAIIAALGVSIQNELVDLEKIRYHKIIIMTDADVDGAHIRTLLMTFFFRKMKPIIENGYLYLAQPPLYFVKKGKGGKYLKNEKELEAYLLKLIGEEYEIQCKGNPECMKSEELIRFLKLVIKKKTLLDKIEKRGMPPVLTNLLIEQVRDENTLKDVVKTKEIVQLLNKMDICSDVTMEFEEEHGLYIINVTYTYKGVVCKTIIDWDYLTGPLFAEVNEAHEKLKEYPEAPYWVNGGIDRTEYISMEDLVEGLFERVKKGVYIQRYKGLGEMNPSQLWETTMNPENRLLLQVNINDLVESEQIFDTLMGLDANKRKEFIQNNALNVKNLDI